MTDISLLEKGVNNQLALMAQLTNKDKQDAVKKIISLWDPLNCPLSHLSWLAWALSITLWNDAWPEHIKRKVVQNSFEVHRYKGTPYSVQKALNNLNIQAQINEWWESELNENNQRQPGTFNVDVFISEQGIDLPLLQQTHEVIKHHKRASAHYNLTMNLSNKTQLNMASTSISSLSATVYPFYAGELKSVDQFLIASAAVSLNQITILPGV
jgi:phage tail P2-like protein